MGEVDGSKEKQWGGKVKRPPNSHLEGAKKSQSSVLYPHDELTEDSSFLLFLRLEGLGASSPFLLPSHGPRMGMSQGSNEKPLDPFLIPQIKPMEQPALDAPPTCVLQRLCWERTPLSLRWG